MEVLFEAMLPGHRGLADAFMSVKRGGGCVLASLAFSESSTSFSFFFPSLKKPILDG
jgi:hypothetical protein